MFPTSAALHPPLKADCSQPWGPSHFLLRPSDLIPSNYLHTLAILKKQKKNKKKLTYISFLLLASCYTLGCLFDAVPCRLLLLPTSVLLSFVASRSRHSASTTLIESSLCARVITPPLPPERSFSLWLCSGGFDQPRSPACDLTCFPPDRSEAIPSPRCPLSCRSLLPCTHHLFPFCRARCSQLSFLHSLVSLPAVISCSHQRSLPRPSSCRLLLPFTACSFPSSPSFFPRRYARCTLFPLQVPRSLLLPTLSCVSPRPPLLQPSPLPLSSTTLRWTHVSPCLSLFCLSLTHIH